MKYENDLEHTKDLFDIENDVPSPIENIEMEGANKDNLTDEFTLGLTGLEEDKVPPASEIPSKEPKEEPKRKKEKKSLKTKWQELPKKKKIIVIVSLVLLLIILIAIILFLILRKDKSPNTPEEPKTPTVIIEKENYIYKDGNLTFLDEENQELGTYECNNKDENLCYVASYSDEDNFDGVKNVYEDGSIIPRRSQIYLNKYVFIYDNSEEENGVIILYNIESKKNEGVYKLVKGFNDSSYVILKNNNNKYGAISFTEDGIVEKIEFAYDYLGMMDKNSKVVGKTNNRYFIYSADGNLESKGLAYEIKSYNDKAIIVDNEGYYIYDYKGNLILDNAYDFITYSGDYIVLVKDSKLYIRDYKGQKYNEDGITLSNNYYNETNIYDQDKTLIETKESFKVNIVENSIEVVYINKNNKEKNTTLNIFEGLVSANYAYLNYLDGKLYFYSDEAKEKLMGTYSCSNKNTIENSTQELSSCIIASESFFSKNETEIDHSGDLGWIPIYNERYVFIMDSLDQNNPTIILYDLKDNKTLSKYANVDASAYTKESKITYSTTSETYIMAKNKNNKYGVIKIGTDTVSSIIPFNYNAVEKLKDYFMVLESAGTYLLIDQNGQEVTGKYGYRIVDYNDNYLKVLNDNKYYLYDFKGNSIDSTGYLYIYLASDYYVVINIDNKLDIHKYNEPSYTLTDAIDIGNTKDYQNAFEVSSYNGGFIVKIKTTNMTYEIDSNGNIVNE